VTLPLTSGVFTALAVALAVSLGANAVTGWAYLGARDDRAKAEVEAKNSAGLAKACSDGVESLRAAAERRATLAETAMRAATAAQKVAEGKAQGLLSKAPTVPGNACASAQAQVDDWLATRKAPK
jgi:hypothetical protein